MSTVALVRRAAMTGSSVKLRSWSRLKVGCTCAYREMTMLSKSM